MDDDTTDWRDPAKLRLAPDARHSDGRFVYSDAEAARRERAAQRHRDVLR